MTRPPCNQLRFEPRLEEAARHGPFFDLGRQAVGGRDPSSQKAQNGGTLGETPKAGEADSRLTGSCRTPSVVPPGPG